MKWIDTITAKQAMLDMASLVDKMHAAASVGSQQVQAAPDQQTACHALMEAYIQIDDLVVLLKTRLSIAYSVADREN